MRYSICIIGAGRIGRIHALNFAALDNCNVKYVVDPNVEAATSLAALIDAEVTTLEMALTDKDVKGVVIASATNTHADFIIEAASASKAIFCEKPIDLSTKRTVDCLNSVKKMGVSLLLGFNRRFDPQFAALKATLEDGAIGRTEMIHITSRDPSPPPASYIASSGGLFKDMMIHDLDMARWLLAEEPCEVYASASCLVDPAIGDEGDVDSALVTLKTKSGKLCQISNSRRAVYGYDQRVEVHGSNGLAQLGNQLDNQICVNTGDGQRSAKLENFFLERYAAAYQAEAKHFIDILEGQAEPLTTGEDGLQALALAEAAALSLKEKRTVLL